VIRPLQDWLIIELDKVPEKSAGIILVAAQDQERMRSGIIKRAGPGRWMPTDNGPDIRVPNDCEVGDRVYFFRENFETMQGKEVQRIVSEVSPGMVMVRARDLLYAEDPSLDDKLYLPEEQLSRLPEEVAAPGGGLCETGGEFGRIPRLHAPYKPLDRKTEPTCAADKVEEREVVLGSALVQSLLGNNP
jgi:co-chaperonin GroES (HSP10)